MYEVHDNEMNNTFEDKTTETKDASGSRTEANTDARGICCESRKPEGNLVERDMGYAADDATIRQAPGDFQVFEHSVPENLHNINIPSKDLTDFIFERDECGDRILLSSGGFGDIYMAQLTHSHKTIIGKAIDAMSLD